ncbi:Plasmid maintenance system antidote protein,XRE family [Tepidanaerobacter acetatoxydans Re1]|uniref:Plasmid maintenance system antidote protein,XRE family n=2 Tax=Tepidanaerobacter acetatoxydans TaxID=499229 RepID=F4LTE1_TEPAE|nr:HigA family addiction module antitoxin [Tepidanaerobacter acetatoxydans]AEE90472.1 plasmid maintenance system antidote protein, XRE family [Tepidanaerobacter acetatoxydans Re1]CCP24971.1 Plasmid maintenance system antidote protein,XRE family [Tepidanaerobacter acetatoxydans Re1]
MAKNMSGLSREFIIHPGETLKEILEDRGMSQKELALRTGVTESHVSSVVNCQKDISVSYAKKLEYALDIDASFWINLQGNYDKELADFEDVNKISDEEFRILKHLNGIIKHLKQIGLLEQKLQGPMLVIQLRKFLNVSSLIRIPELSQAGAYRLATETKVDPYVLFTWLRMCDLITDNQQIEQKLDVSKLKEKIPPIKELMFEDVVKIQPRLKSYLAECGIRFSIVKHFRGAPVQGVIKKNSDGTLSLLMTTRRKFADIFWFTFFHEIGHIIHGDIEDKLIDYEFIKNEAEDRANKFAENILIEAEGYSAFIEKGDFSLPSIKRFSVEQNIPTYVLIGRLQKDGHVRYYQYRGEKVKYVMEEG